MVDPSLPLREFAIAAGATVLCHAAAHDLVARTIPDIDSAALAALGLLHRHAQQQMLVSLGVAALVLLLCRVLWTRRWLGGGDVKLIPACCCVVAPAQVPGLLGAIMCAGGVLALLYLGGGVVARRMASDPLRGPDLRGPDLRGPELHGWRRFARLEAWRARRGAGLPYGVAISAATLFTFFAA